MDRPTPEQVRGWLAQVPDPEIPVLSLVDLGVIRALQWRGDRLVVTVTPTYSGCPASAVIRADIAAALSARGLEDFELEERLSPAWSSDWISPGGRRKLAEYGIAPPQRSGRPAACPHCGGDDLERVAQFGSTPCKALWKCRTCLEPFDYFKCI